MKSKNDKFRTSYIILFEMKFINTKNKYQSYPKSTKIDAFIQNICTHHNPVNSNAVKKCLKNNLKCFKIIQVLKEILND